MTEAISLSAYIRPAGDLPTIADAVSKGGDLNTGQTTLSTLTPFAVVYIIVFSWQGAVSPLVPIAVLAFPGWMLFQLCRYVDK